MDVKEKLVEVIESARYWGSNTSEEIAGHLIAHGVTVQERGFRLRKNCRRLADMWSA